MGYVESNLVNGCEKGVGEGRAGLPLLGCMRTLYLRVSLIILDENI
jgi:hypothetical protein